MKAVLIRENGDASKLEYAEVDEPVAGTGQVLIEVEAAGLNFIDIYHRIGLYPADLPLVLGLEGAGRVVEVGPGVTDRNVGDRVAWADGSGSYAELVTLDADHLVTVPEAIGADAAGAVMLQGLTAHYLATDTYPLSAGDTCLVHAGAGGVGLLLTQMAKNAGATVVTTVGTPAKAKTSRDAGSDHVVIYSDGDFATEITEKLGKRPFDVVYDGVGQATFEQSLDLLKPRGLMVTFGNASGPVPEIAPLILSRKGSLYLTRPTLRDYIQTKEELRRRAGDLFEWMSSGRLEVKIGASLRLWEAAKAHRMLEGRESSGKIILQP